MESQTTNTTFSVVNGKVVRPETAPPVVTPTTKVFTHEQLLKGLYFIFDAFKRCSINFFLVRETAHNAMTEHMLEGDHLDIGIRKLEWVNDQKELLFPFFEQEHVEIVNDLPDIITCKWQDIPFTIHLYDDNLCTTALVPIVYEHEHWKIPNRFDLFEKDYDK